MPSERPLRVGITGVSSDLGRGLLPLLQADERVGRIVAFDIAVPSEPGEKLEYVRVDLTRPGSEADLSATMREANLDVLYHLAFVNSRVHGAAFAHELEVIGSMHVLAAAQAARLPRLIVPSLTALYGARRQAPAFLTEHHALAGCEGSRFITDRVEVEHQLEAFVARNTDTHVVVLRFAPLVGKGSDNPFTRLLRTRFVPTVAGFDPLWQVVHDSDAATALHLVLTCAARGIFNIVSPDVLPLSTLVRLAGAVTVPMFGPVLRGTIKVLETASIASVPLPLLDFLRYSWVADGTRAWHELRFVPRTPAYDAVRTVMNGGN